MGILSLLGCNKFEKIYSDNENFTKIENKSEISSKQAFEIYKDSFAKNFTIKESPYDKESFYQVVYICNGFYYIGFASKNDKRTEKTTQLIFLAKINSDTGEISVVK